MINMRYFIGAAQWSLNVVAQSLAPPSTATSKSIRINGAACILLGMLCIAVFSAAILLLRAPLALLLIPSLLAYAFFTIGGYRLIRGKDTAARYPGEVSLARIALGCLSVVFCFALLVGMIWIASALFEK